MPVTTMKVRARAMLAGAATVIAVMALLPEVSLAQPDGDDIPSDDEYSAATTFCDLNGSDAHYEESLT